MRRPRESQETRSHRSRSQILEAALELFSHRGYGATSIRDIADAAGVSTGNVYHHFRDKDAIFNALLDQYWTAIEQPDFVFNRALVAKSFPDNLEEIGEAARDMVIQYRRHVALIYVDVVEFEGQHIRKFYSEMAERFGAFAASNPERLMAGRLRQGVTPGDALMMVSRFFFNYFAVEILFGVPDHFGKQSGEAIRQICDILRFGLVADRERPAASSVTTPTRT